MPIRKTPLVNGEYYHVFNRGVNKQPIFLFKRDYERAIETIRFYLKVKQPFSYSRFISLPKIEKELFLKEIENQENLVDLVSFCLLPNHFHFLLKQNTENGISKFMKRFQISYTLFFNKKHKREGPLLNGRFKAVLIEDTDQLLHVSRDIHLNPYSSHLVRDIPRLLEYKWSSLNEYLGNCQSQICSKEIILKSFKSKDYKEFVLNNADYQRRLKEIKHLLFE